MIEIAKATKKYGKATIVGELSLKINSGSVFGFLGPNGAGKTTTMKMLVGLSQPDAGEIKIDDKKASSIETRKNTGYMPEDPYFYDHLTGYEFLEFCLALSSPTPLSLRAQRARQSNSQIASSQAPRNDKTKCIDIIDLVGLSNAKNKMISAYSKGMKQRLGLAQAIIHQPKYIFLDEPLDGLDPIGRNDFKNIFRELKKQGSTIFLNSHILSDVEELCDEIGIINHGKLLYSGKVTAFCEKGKLEGKFVEIIEKNNE